MTDTPQGDRAGRPSESESTYRAWGAVGGADAESAVPVDPVTGEPTGPTTLPPLTGPGAPAVAVAGPPTTGPAGVTTAPATGSGAFTLPPAGPGTLAPTPESAGDPTAPPPEPTPALVAKDLSLVTGDGVIFRAIDLVVQPGTVAAIVGPSGTGRSCLLLSLTGRMAHSAGVLTVAGHDATEGLDHLRSLTGVARISHRIGPEPSLTVAESVDERCLLEDVPLAEGRQRFVEVCQTLELDVAPSTLVRDIGGVDGTKLAVALAAVRVSAVLVLDDLDGGVSGQDEFDLLHALMALAATGPAIVVTTTDPYPVADAHTVIVMPDRAEPEPVVVVADAVVVEVAPDATAEPLPDAPTQVVSLDKTAVTPPDAAPVTPEAAGPPPPPSGTVAAPERRRRWPFGRRGGRHAAPEAVGEAAAPAATPVDPAAVPSYGHHAEHPADPPTDVFPIDPTIYGPRVARDDDAASAWWTEPRSPAEPKTDDPAVRPPADPPSTGDGPAQGDHR
ncbi:ATP-binding cassette domain-containing protein [Nakamurella flava]|uniref:ATP-binding cassette domain-containing protein n=1 Tax=Nakamurella flava TaxID=2576308 RepID=A0A4U6QEQ4_9ACTN|nr:ATP-binding cassette domain-containing protein [Nakamurella flava]TKV58476.1 ATP-binding cassette domain-containing protein [Nakamurella flava]